MSENANPIATIETTKGEMTLELWKDVAPGTVENFTKLANDGFYDGTCFHRIMAGFMIQGGDPQTKDQSLQDLWGTGGPGHTIKAEFSDRPHVRGVISMARSANPDSAGSQFFICLGKANFLDGQYTAFGALSSGDDVLGAIGVTPVESSNSGENSKPKERIEVTSIRVS
ncbi:MAG: peptidylprolyl isomerase [Verrucomicrobiota bacterium]|nr:peptidylprolyl isomerase [Verrucomicrobiota bacterium]